MEQFKNKSPIPPSEYYDYTLYRPNEEFAAAYQMDREKGFIGRGAFGTVYLATKKDNPQVRRHQRITNSAYNRNYTRSRKSNSPLTMTKARTISWLVLIIERSLSLES